MSINVLACVVRSIAFRIGCVLLCLTAAVPGKGIADISSTYYMDFFCGAPIRSAQEPVTVAPVGNATVSIVNFTFSPSNLQIQVGDTITWTNNDSVGHTATSDAGVWDSGFLEPGQTFSFTFTSTGIFPYHCSPHPVHDGEHHCSSRSLTDTNGNKYADIYTYRHKHADGDKYLDGDINGNRDEHTDSGVYFDQYAYEYCNCDKYRDKYEHADACR